MLIADKKEDGVHDSVMIFAIFSIASADTPDPRVATSLESEGPTPRSFVTFNHESKVFASLYPQRRLRLRLTCLSKCGILESYRREDVA